MKDYQASVAPRTPHGKGALTRCRDFLWPRGEGAARRRARAAAFLLGILPMIAASPLAAQTGPDPAGPSLAAASNFGQGLDRAKLDAALALGLRDFRDAVYWRDVEQEDGSLVFEGRHAWPDLLAEAGATMSLTVNNSHPAHDGGTTPHSDAGRAAFARFAAAARDRFPAITAIEVGNEMNSDTFVSGPWREADTRPRAALYGKLLGAVSRRLRSEGRPVRVIGGAAHSVPLTWLSAMLGTQGAGAMDALALHPYTTAPEQLVRQVALLRALPGLSRMPIEITEFGTKRIADAPGHMLRSYCQMALAGVRRAAWYPLGARGDGFAPLIGEEGEATPAGRTFALISAQMAGRPARAIRPDPFTYGCTFGADVSVLWGAPRTLALGEGMRAATPTGTPLPAEGLRLSRTAPLVIFGEARNAAGASRIALGPTGLIADSFDEFAYPRQAAVGGGTGVATRAATETAPKGGFRYLSLIDGETAPLELRPGQEKSGAPWYPYLGSARDGMLRAGPDWVLPSAWGDRPLSVILRHEAQAPIRADLELRLAPRARSTDGVSLTVSLGGEVIAKRMIAEPERIILRDLPLGPGRLLDITTGPGGSASGDVTSLRATLRRAGSGAEE
ncbi:hypothetical protein [Profundibacterium mesophilum]|uniref:Beta-xylosidase n=1 Tax=Profundibacterium mesophilum KAUST100406-0324 TaxID=1037889 RepID=A0A921TCC6_9RHOB|nr:hypothetical protein [Profundibacterium mesophilum]KAF0676935.1 beta-xylosidase [Profundibacterium mesophilum KAUST100406-0324]